MQIYWKKAVYVSLILFTSLSIAYGILTSSGFQTVIDAILPVWVLGAVLGGIFYTSFLSSPVSLAMLFVLSQHANPILLALVAGLGSIIGDLLIVKLFRSNFFSKTIVFNHPALKIIKKFLVNYKLEFIVQLTALVIIASPFPDEIGLAMLGISQMPYKQLALLSYVLNTVGILMIVLPFNLL